MTQATHDQPIKFADLVGAPERPVCDRVDAGRWRVQDALRHLQLKDLQSRIEKILTLPQSAHTTPPAPHVPFGTTTAQGGSATPYAPQHARPTPPPLVRPRRQKQIPRQTNRPPDAVPRRRRETAQTGRCDQAAPPRFRRGQEAPSAPTTSNVPPVALGDLQRQLLAIITSQPNEASAVAQLMQVVYQVTRAVGLVYFRRNADQQFVAGPRLRSEQLPLDQQRLQWLAEACTKACADNRVQIHALPGSHLISVSVPVPMPSGAAHSLCGILHDSATLAYGLAILQLASAYLSLWHVRSTSLHSEQDASSAAALVEMISRVQACDELESAGYRLVKDMQEYLGCQRVALGIRPHGTSRCQLVSLSGLSEFDRRAELVQALELAMEEAILGDRLTIWPVPGNQQAATLGHKRLARLAEVDTVASAPLKDLRGKVLGAWVFLGDRALAGDTRRHHMIEAATPHVASCLALVRRKQRGHLFQLAEAIWRQRRSRRVGVAASILLLACAGMLLPLRQRIGCDVRLEPLVHRYVAAPFAGTLKRTLCQPGDLVKADQLLAQLDDRELRWELAGLVAEHQRAAKEHDVALATHDAASAQQARLRMQRLALRIELLEHRSAHVDIKSPIDGIVVRGDLATAVGVPVDTGQTLVEVAPLDQMGAEIAVPDENIASVMVGAPVSIRLDSDPRRKRRGILNRIHPAAEIVNAENVFIGQVVLDNSDGALRPGMAGRATVYAARRPLAWLLLGKPWHVVLRALGG